MRNLTHAHVHAVAINASVGMYIHTHTHLAHEHTHTHTHTHTSARQPIDNYDILAIGYGPHAIHHAVKHERMNTKTKQWCVQYKDCNNTEDQKDTPIP